jgi:hypothetical protein
MDAQNNLTTPDGAAVKSTHVPSLVLSILGLVSALSIFLVIFAYPLAIVGLVQSNKRRATHNTKAAMVISIIDLVAAAIGTAILIPIILAIFVPAGIGYSRNSDITRANANAKTVHTAVATALADAAMVVGSEPPSLVIIYGGGGTERWGEYTVNWSDLLGYDFEGVGMVEIVPEAFAAVSAGWGENEAIATKGLEASKSGVTAERQKEDAKNATSIYGMYPIRS